MRVVTVKDGAGSVYGDPSFTLHGEKIFVRDLDRGLFVTGNIAKHSGTFRLHYYARNDFMDIVLSHNSNECNTKAHEFAIEQLIQPRPTQYKGEGVEGLAQMFAECKDDFDFNRVFVTYLEELRAMSRTDLRELFASVSRKIRKEDFANWSACMFSAGLGR